MQELDKNTKNIIETLKEIASTPEIKKYCYSTGFHLFEYAIGFEENDKFTGVVVYNQKIFYLERSTIIELDVNINNLMNNYSKELKTSRNKGATLLPELIGRIKNGDYTPTIKTPPIKSNNKTYIDPYLSSEIDMDNIPF